MKLLSRLKKGGGGGGGQRRKSSSALTAQSVDGSVLSSRCCGNLCDEAANSGKREMEKQSQEGITSATGKLCHAFTSHPPLPLTLGSLASPLFLFSLMSVQEIPYTVP